jgi:hypothetical protein
MRRGAVAGVAAVVLKYRDHLEATDVKWARDVLNRAAGTPEERDLMWSTSSVIPWHPCISVAKGLGLEIRAGDQNRETRRQLLRLISHPLDVVSLSALEQAFALWDAEPRLGWCALWQGLALCQFEVRPMEAGPGRFDPEHIAQERVQRANEAIAHFESTQSWPELPPMPPAWVQEQGSEVAALVEHDDDNEELPTAPLRWREPDTVWDWNVAENILGLVPYSEIMHRPETREPFLTFSRGLIDWVIEKIAPPRKKKPGRRERGQNFFKLDMQVGHMFAMLAAELDTPWIRKTYLDPVFALEDDLCFDLLASFVDRYVCISILDAPAIPENGIEILRICLERVLQDPVFEPHGYRAGELHGWKLPSLARSLLFISVDEAKLASRFANGDWRDVGIVMPLIDRFVRAAGWSASIMGNYLTMCERARATYPAEEFADQVLAVLMPGRTRLKGWRGTLLPARIAGLVQHFAFREKPMKPELGQKFLRILDILVDMGDRRSAALQISDSFREIKAA